jgi:hypothetical protein
VPICRGKLGRPAFLAEIWRNVGTKTSSLTWHRRYDVSGAHATPTPTSAPCYRPRSSSTTARRLTWPRAAAACSASSAIRPDPIRTRRHHRRSAPPPTRTSRAAQPARGRNHRPPSGLAHQRAWPPPTDTPRPQDLGSSRPRADQLQTRTRHRRRKLTARSRTRRRRAAPGMAPSSRGA